MENVRQTAFQTLHDLLKATERNALLALLQTMKCRGGKSEFFGKLSKSHITAFLAKKRSKLFFQSVTHSAMLANISFRLRNKLIDNRARTWKTNAALCESDSISCVQGDEHLWRFC
jgi:hypothetical protein